MKYVINVNDLRKSYAGRWRTPPTEALKGISFTVAEGEVFGFIGPNGAGKSTTIKILTGITKASSGEALLFGANVSDPQSRVHLGYVPENPNLPDYLTPLELLLMRLKANKVSTPSPESLCLDWLERLDLKHVANRLIRGFSKGMNQRTALAHAMIGIPRLLILDEPLSGLDPIGRKDVVDLLAEFKNQGGAIFLTSHVLHDVERLADRFGLIHQGELKTIASPTDLLGDDDMLTIRSIGFTPVSGMTEESGSRWIGTCPRKSIWPLLSALEKTGHRIIEIKPALNLEAAFLEYVQK